EALSHLELSSSILPPSTPVPSSSTKDLCTNLLEAARKYANHSSNGDTNWGLIAKEMVLLGHRGNEFMFRQIFNEIVIYKYIQCLERMCSQQSFPGFGLVHAMD